MILLLSVFRCGMILRNDLITITGAQARLHRLPSIDPYAAPEHSNSPQVIRQAANYTAFRSAPQAQHQQAIVDPWAEPPSMHPSIHATHQAAVGPSKSWNHKPPVARGLQLPHISDNNGAASGAGEFRKNSL